MAITQRVVMPGSLKRGGGQMETIMDGLKIAQVVYGIKTASEQADLDKRRLDLAEKRREEDVEFRESQAATAKEQRAEDVAFRDKKLDFEKQKSEAAKIIAAQRKKAEEEARAAQREVDEDDRKFSRASKLGKRWENASKSTFNAIDGFRRIEAAATNPTPTGVTDLALLFGFMKSIDPDSVVRESEFRTAEERQPIPERVKVWRDKILETGATLTPEQRSRFFLEAKRSIFNRLEEQENTDERFMRLANQFGVDPEFVIDPSFAELAERLRQDPAVRAGLDGTMETGLISETKPQQPTVAPQPSLLPTLQGTTGFQELQGGQFTFGGRTISGGSPSIVPQQRQPQFVQPPIQAGGMTIIPGVPDQQEKNRRFLNIYLQD